MPYVTLSKGDSLQYFEFVAIFRIVSSINRYKNECYTAI